MHHLDKNMDDLVENRLNIVRDLEKKLNTLDRKRYDYDSIRYQIWRKQLLAELDLARESVDRARGYT